jgi:hypothetical protein
VLVKDVGQKMWGKRCWAKDVGQKMLGERCWGKDVGQKMLGKRCWAKDVGRKMWGERCGAKDVGAKDVGDESVNSLVRLGCGRLSHRLIVRHRKRDFSAFIVSLRYLNSDSIDTPFVDVNIDGFYTQLTKYMASFASLGQENDYTFEDRVSLFVSCTWTILKACYASKLQQPYPRTPCSDPLWRAVVVRSS